MKNCFVIVRLIRSISASLQTQNVKLTLASTFIMFTRNIFPMFTKGSRIRTERSGMFWKQTLFYSYTLDFSHNRMSVLWCVVCLQHYTEADRNGQFGKFSKCSPNVLQTFMRCSHNKKKIYTYIYIYFWNIIGNLN